MADVHGIQNGDGSDYQRPETAELFRMIWLAFGPAGIVFSGLGIWKRPPWTYSVLDVVFWSIAALVLIARFVDIRLFRGKTTDDKPATMSHFWRYAAKFMLIAAAIWLLAQWRQA